MIKKSNPKNIPVTPAKTNEFIIKSRLFPLFDIKTFDIYLININNIHKRVTIDNYRLLNQDLLNYLESEYKLSNSKHIHDLIIFVKKFDFDILEQFYYKLFYLSSNNNEITNCIKPSYLPYMNTNPYYTTSELLNMALNMGLTNDEHIKLSELEKFCNQVSKNDISAALLQQHQEYIMENNCKHLIQYYSLLGYYDINSYLRKKINVPYITSNAIELLYDLILKAPKNEKDIIVYRFVESDAFLKNVKVNDIFSDNGFVSTTRNPFYTPKTHYFGLVLMKIHIKKKFKYLCIESFSHFPNEQEILLPPCKLKLISKNDNFKYYHIDKYAQQLINTKYEFELVDIIQPSIKKSKQQIQQIDVNELQKSHFDDVDEFYCITKSGKYLINIKQHQNAILYQKFFYTQNCTYFVYYTSNMTPVFTLEIDDNIASLNYYNKYGGINSFDYIDANDLFTITMSIAQCYQVNMIMHGNYNTYEQGLKKLKDQNKSPDDYKINRYNAMMSTYSMELYDYIKGESELNNLYSKYAGKIYDIKIFIKLMDCLQKPFVIPYNSDDYIALTTIYEENSFTNIRELYIYIHKYAFYMMETLQILISKYYLNYVYNVFDYIIHYFDVNKYLYNIGLINEKYTYDKIDIKTYFRPLLANVIQTENRHISI